MEEIFDLNLQIYLIAIVLVATIIAHSFQKPIGTIKSHYELKQRKNIPRISDQFMKFPVSRPHWGELLRPPETL